MIPYITNFDFISFTLVGNDVILTGWTVRDTNRSDAEFRVKKIPGVANVINNIEILPLGGQIWRSAQRHAQLCSAISRHTSGAMAPTSRLW